MKYKLLLLSFFLLYTNLFGDDWIINNDDGSKSKYNNLIILENDTLYVEKSENIIGVSIENINKITHRKKYTFKKAFYGCAGIYGASVVGMIIVGLATHSEDGELVGAIGGAAVGYILTRNHFIKRFDLTQMSNEEKKDIINILISKDNLLGD